MGSTETGELFTQEQYDAMPLTRREELKIVGITPEESAHLQGMNRKDRRDWMRKNKKFNRRNDNVKTT
jgi:hypothetical protein